MKKRITIFHRKQLAKMNKNKRANSVARKQQNPRTVEKKIAPNILDNPESGEQSGADKSNIKLQKMDLNDSYINGRDSINS